MQIIGEHGAFEAEPRGLVGRSRSAIERDRGYDHVSSAHGPGAFTLMLAPGQDACLTATTEPWEHLDGVPPDQAWEHELTRRQRLLASSDESLQQPDTFLLPLAADQFIIRPATRAVDDAQAYAVGAEPRTVIAGYPWFTDWGRDTMISLEGLALVTGRHSEAHDILRTFALHVRHGLIPNLFPEGQREGLYHTADATLWFFHALHRYDTDHRRSRARRGTAAGAAGHRAVPSDGHGRSTSTSTPTGCWRRARPASSSRGWTPSSTAGW